jgi:DNA (cytosine-5)-methyltransferase 1
MSAPAFADQDALPVSAPAIPLARAAARGLPARPWNGFTVLDGFCCQGGAGMGYWLAGFDVVGVDITDQPRYPFRFVQGDAVEFIREHGHRFDIVHASCPCQGYSETQRLRGNTHPLLIAATRTELEATGRPWVMENVPGAPLRPDAVLCGAMFGLRTYRHRLFETRGGLTLAPPAHPGHAAPVAKMGRPRQDGEFAHYVGNFPGVAEARTDLGVAWMNRDGIRECIPPAYTRWLGHQAARQLNTVAGVAA